MGVYQHSLIVDCLLAVIGLVQSGLNLHLVSVGVYKVEQAEALVLVKDLIVNFIYLFSLK